MNRPTVHIPISSLSLDHHLYVDDTQWLSSSFLSTHSTLTQAFLTFKTLFYRSLPGWLLIFLLFNSSSKTEFLLIGPNQLAKIHNSSLNISYSARNLGFIFDEHLTFSDQITSLSKACYYHIRQLRCNRPYLDSSTACTIANSIVHSKLDYCNSLYYKLPKSQLSRLQQIQNSVARTVVKAPKSCHITLILRSLHWFRINERIEYKLLSLTYLQSSHNYSTFITSSLFDVLVVLTLQSSSVVTLARPPTSSCLIITDRSFRFASRCLWNQFPLSLHQPHSGTSFSMRSRTFGHTVSSELLYWWSTRPQQVWPVHSDRHKILLVFCYVAAFCKVYRYINELVIDSFHHLGGNGNGNGIVNPWVAMNLNSF